MANSNKLWRGAQHPAMQSVLKAQAPHLDAIQRHAHTHILLLLNNTAAGWELKEHTCK